VSTYGAGICEHCGKPIERVSHQDDPPPEMWIHVTTRRANCGLYASPLRADRPR
jgi:hypothetical protein